MFWREKLLKAYDKYFIIKGPSEIDLMFALFGRDRGCNKVAFTVRRVGKSKKTEREIRLEVTIVGLAISSGDYNWEISGFFLKEDAMNSFEATIYNHKTRKGEVSIG